mmetsp:Transcript_40937/g.70005  ORF Transcript_40937/g.70005 Transcript_40937/m.70005 type:complete len:331 (-) Transcript_40937:611-1603(-)
MRFHGRLDHGIVVRFPHVRYHLRRLLIGFGILIGILLGLISHHLFVSLDIFHDLLFGHVPLQSLLQLQFLSMHFHGGGHHGVIMSGLLGFLALNHRDDILLFLLILILLFPFPFLLLLTSLLLLVVVAVVIIIIGGRILRLSFRRLRRLFPILHSVHHAAYQVRPSPHEVLVVIRSHLRTAGDALEVPSLQPSREGGVLGTVEVRREDFRREEVLVVNRESASVGQPREDVTVRRIGDDFEEDFGKVESHSGGIVSGGGGVCGGGIVDRCSGSVSGRVWGSLLLLGLLVGRSRSLRLQLFGRHRPGALIDLLAFGGQRRAFSLMGSTRAR